MTSYVKWRGICCATPFVRKRAARFYLGGSHVLGVLVDGVAAVGAGGGVLLAVNAVGEPPVHRLLPSLRR